MATPDDMAHVARGVRGIYADAEEAILQKMARTAARTGAPTGFQQSVLAERQRMSREVDRIVRDLDAKVPGAVQEVVDLGYNRGAGFAADEAAQAGIKSALFGGSTDTGSAVALARAAREPLGSMGYQIKRWTNDVYDDVTQRAAAEVATGTLTTREASQNLLQRLSSKGVTGFTDRSGRQWEMGAYAEMATRTATAQAQLAGHTEKLSALGIDTAMISDSPEECDLCEPWENAVVSISGKTSGTLSDGQYVMGSLSEARAAGVFHANCTHSIGIYVPGVTKARTEAQTSNPEGGALRVKQRSFERRIRELKRDSIIADEFGGAGRTLARSKLAAKQTEFAQWREANNRKNLSYRTSLKARGPGPAPMSTEAVTPAMRQVAAEAQIPVEAVQVAKTSRAGMFTVENTHAWTDDDFMALIGESFDDPELLDKLESILDAREAAATVEVAAPVAAPVAETAATRAAAEQAVAIDPFTGKPYGQAAAKVGPKKTPSALKREMEERDYRDYVDLQYLKAEDETAGVLVNKLGKAKGIDGYELFMGDVRTARKYASEELIAFWEESGRHTKTSLDWMINQTPSSRASYNRVVQAGFQGGRIKRER